MATIEFSQEAAAERIRKIRNMEPPVLVCEHCGMQPDMAAYLAKQLVRFGLTPKETQIATLIFKGLATKEIASATGNTDKTVKHHIASVFLKLDVSSRAELFSAVFPT